MEIYTVLFLSLKLFNDRANMEVITEKCNHEICPACKGAGGKYQIELIDCDRCKRSKPKKCQQCNRLGKVFKKTYTTCDNSYCKRGVIIVGEESTHRYKESHYMLIEY